MRQIRASRKEFNKPARIQIHQQSLHKDKQATTLSATTDQDCARGTRKNSGAGEVIGHGGNKGRVSQGGPEGLKGRVFSSNEGGRDEEAI